MNGFVSDIQRFSVHDGYGIRTIVFLAGCSLCCKWCQNPEALDLNPAVMHSAELCAGCGGCVQICPAGGSVLKEGRVLIDREKCGACFACVEQCDFDARRRTIKTMSAEEVFAEFIRDEVFYRNSGGGITLSGGEPLTQLEFSKELLIMTKNKGFHTAIETAGHVPYASIESVLPYTDLFLYDIKILDEQTHKAWTGVSNKQILHNIEKLSGAAREIIIRVPLIPDVNGGDEFFSIVDFVKRLGINEIHILPYHAIGSGKYGQLGMDYTMEGHKEDNAEEIEACKNYALSKGLKVSVGGVGF